MVTTRTASGAMNECYRRLFIRRDRDGVLTGFTCHECYVCILVRGNFRPFICHLSHKYVLLVMLLAGCENMVHRPLLFHRMLRCYDTTP